ncbi:hypothetical protein E2C01_075217 [Portunus trituberculatus]|uniref:Uncharacterized protein n=1 Tax=Portunus trituberculatus TaxID=210409 RepID=A0A5B7IEF9_PORTR|nr:hypothetical protein [Portunus trituberculatus]
MHHGKARLGDDIFTCQSEQRLIGSEGGGMVAEMCWCGETTASPALPLRSPRPLTPAPSRPRLAPRPAFITVIRLTRGPQDHGALRILASCGWCIEAGADHSHRPLLADRRTAAGKGVVEAIGSGSPRGTACTSNLETSPTYARVNLPGEASG